MILQHEFQTNKIDFYLNRIVSNIYIKITAMLKQM